MVYRNLKRFYANERVTEKRNWIRKINTKEGQVFIIKTGCIFSNGLLW